MISQTESQPWSEMLSTEQRKFLNAICGDLAAQNKLIEGITK